MKLPVPSPVYNRLSEMERNRTLEIEDRRNHKRGQDVEIAEARLILTSPDGTRWSITVDNAGVISATSI